MGLFSHNPFKKVTRGIGKMLGSKGGLSILLGKTIGELFGKDDVPDYNEPAAPKPVEETPVQAPSQSTIGTPTGKGSDVGLGDVTSIFDDDDDEDPFKKLFM